MSLAPYACHPQASLGRVVPEPESALRSVYQRDRDRIVHSIPFRRLEYKTQVFVNFEGDHFRTRLTHSLEVAQIARSIARVLEVNEDLAEHFCSRPFEDFQLVADPAADGMNPDGPLAGVPFLMKDLGPTLKGRLQEFGSLFMRGNRPAEDAWLTRQMRRAGLNLIGRTTTPEFGVCSSAENPAVYVTRNPWNTGFTTCGSSAGSAAMVAAGVVPIAHATDGGARSQLSRGHGQLPTVHRRGGPTFPLATPLLGWSPRCGCTCSCPRVPCRSG